MPHRPQKPVQSAPLRKFEFHAAFSGNVERGSGVIRGVALITSGVQARGHDLEVDDQTVKQLHALAVKKGKVSVKLDHGSGITSLCGYITNFSIQGKKLIGDWHLLKSHQEYETTLERAEVMPECFGMSAAFMGNPVTETGDLVLVDEKGISYTHGQGGIKKPLSMGAKKLARCTELLAVDCVTQPAANPDGLFEAKEPGVDSRQQVIMPDENANENSNANPEPTLADILKAVQGLTQKVDAQQEIIEALQSGEVDGDLTLEDLSAMSDEELAALDLTRAEVQQAVIDASEGNDPGANGNGNAGANPGTSESAPAGATPAVAAALSDLRRKINYFEAKEKRDAATAEAQAIEHAFSVLQEKAEAVIQENKALKVELETAKAALKTAGSQPVKTGAGGTEILFSAKQAPAGSYEQVVTTKFNELKAQVEKGALTELAAKGQAIDFGVKHNGGATYAEYRKRGGKLQL